MDISPTLAKQEVDVIQKILEQLGYSESIEEVQLAISQFEGKHFSHFTPEQLFQRVKDISTKLRNSQLINDYSVRNNEKVIQGVSISFDVKGKIPRLQQFKLKVENDIAKIELQSKLKKVNYCRLEGDIFFFTLPDGFPQPMPLYTERSSSNHLFLIFKILYEHWKEFSGQTITKSSMKNKLNKLGWNDVNDKDISNFIGNIRKTKIKPARLSSYVEIIYHKEQNGYELKITYP